MMQELNQQLRSRFDVRSLFVMALITVLIFSIGWLYTVDRVNGSHVQAHALLDQAARQRMYSQQLALIATRLVFADREVERELLRDELTVLVDRMSAAHEDLMARLPAEIRAMFLEPPLMLDTDLRAYLSQVTLLSSESGALLTPTHPAYRFIVREASTHLLNELEAMVEAYESYSNNVAAAAGRMSVAVFSTTLGIFVVIIMVFLRPLLVGRIEQENASLRSAQQMNIRILNAVPGAIFVRDVTAPDGYRYFSDRFADLTGYSVDEVRAWPASIMFQVCHPDDLPRLREAVTHLLTLKDGQQFTMDYRVRHRKGHYIWINTTARVFERDQAGAVKQIIGHVKDVTEQKEAELALVESRQQFNELANSLPLMISRLRSSPDGSRRFTYLSERCLDITGIRPEDVLADPTRLFNIVHPDDADRYWQTIEEVTRTQTDFSWEGRVIVDGQVRWHQIHSRPHVQPNGDVYWNAYEIDVTDFKRTQLALEESRQRYDELVENLPMLIFRLEISPDNIPCFTYLSSKCELITGVPREAALENMVLLFNVVHPDDIEGFLQANNHALFEKGSFAWEGRFLVKGEVRWHHIESHPTVRDDGSMYWDGFQMDITDRKTSEIAVQQKNHLIERILETSPNVITIADLRTRRIVFSNQDGIIEYSEDAHDSTDTMTLDEVFAAIHPDDLPGMLQVYRELEEDRTGSILRHEYRSKFANVWTWNAVDLVVFQHDADGKPTQVLTIHEDITARKQAELEVQEKNHFIERVLSLTPNMIAIFDLHQNAVIFANRGPGKKVPSTILYDPEGSTIEDVFGVIYEEDWPVLHKGLGAVRNIPDGENLSFDYRVHLADGTLGWHRSTITVFQRDPDGIVAQIIGINEDITARKQTEIALQEKNHFINRVLHTTPNTINIFDLATNRVIFSNRDEGTQLQDQQGFRIVNTALETFLAGIHPDDQPNIIETLTRLATGPDGEIIHYEFRTAHEGGWRWYASEIVVFQRDASGMPSQVLAINEDITDRKQAEIALRASEARYRALARNFPNGSVVIFDRELRYVLADGEDMRLKGFDPSSMIGQHIREALPADFCDIVEPYYYAALAGKSAVFEIGFGGSHYVAHALPLAEEDGAINTILVVTQDITARKRAEDALRQSEQQFKLLVNTIEDAFWMYDVSEERFTYFSPANEAIWDVSLEELYQSRQSLYHGVHPDDRVLLNQIQLRSFSEPSEGEIRLVRGAFERWIRVRSFPIFADDGTVTRIVGLGENITERKQAAQQAVDLEIERERVRLLQRFISAASHDLRTPLAVMKASFYLVRKLPDPSERMHYLDEVERQTEHLRAMIEDLLTMSRLDMRDMAMTPLDLCSLLMQLVEEQQPLAQAQGHVLALNARTESAMVLASEPELRRALLNLIINALKYTPGKGHVTVIIKTVERLCQIQIVDDGIGIESHHLPHIFDSFYRVDEAHQQGGTGLGLAITRKIIEQHNGKVTAESEYGVGSVFSVTLPLC